ncbi:hypothetical protein [Methanolobus sp. WCC4]|uniref:hypothetical protein n=1 Tax=Methanolobus sp. WCC4 TaxID=3125784 RepID=UPI0030F8BABB
MINITLLLILSIMLCIIPGYAIFSSFLNNENYDFIQTFTISLVLGLSATPIILLFFSIIDIKLNRTIIYSLILCSILIISYNCSKNNVISCLNKQLKISFDKASIIMISIFLTNLMIKLFINNNQIVPLGIDSYAHVMITSLIVENESIPKSYMPFMPIDNFTYHFGFHALSGFISWVTGAEIASSVLIAETLLIALPPLTIYVFTLSLLKDKKTALISAFIVSFISIFPAYYLNWGRMTQIMGLTILPILITVLLTNFDKNSYHHIIVSSILLSGLFLSHYRIFIMFMYFLLLIFISDVLGKNISMEKIQKIFVLFVLFTAITGPWMLNLFDNSNFIKTVNVGEDSTRISPEYYYSLDRVHYLYSDYSNYLFVIGESFAYLLIFAGILLGFYKKQNEIILLSFWIFVLLIFSNPHWLDFPINGLIDFITVLSVLWVPISIICGYLICSLLNKTILGKKEINFIVSIIILLIVTSSIVSQIQLIKPSSQYVFEPDVDAMCWINENTKENSQFLISSEKSIGFVEASDAGSWIPIFTQRQVSVPSMLYGGEGNQDLLDQVKLLHEASNNPSSNSSLEIFKKYNVTHVYIGVRKTTNSMNIANFTTCDAFKLIYNNNGVYIFEIQETNTKNIGIVNQT